MGEAAYRARPEQIVILRSCQADDARDTWTAWPLGNLHTLQSEIRIDGCHRTQTCATWTLLDLPSGCSVEYVKSRTAAKNSMILSRTVWQIFAFVFLTLALQCAEVKGDADFESVRVLMTKDSSGKGGDPKDKYWRKSVEQLSLFCIADCLA